MKNVAVLLSVLTFSVPQLARAETVTLIGPVASQVLGVQQYPNVPNDAGIEGLWIRTSARIGLPDAVTVIASEPDMQCGGTLGQVLTCTVGSAWLMLNLQSHNAGTTCVRSGRGQHCSAHWVLDGGTLERP